mmetsp:Transcript_73511/g.186277  ORF Transcript_73511/g.186277 Transcript_73511/m.186277 type:complete len:487 (+) Transcript_73511:84-1544(+)
MVGAESTPAMQPTSAWYFRWRQVASELIGEPLEDQAAGELWRDARQSMKLPPHSAYRYLVDEYFASARELMNSDRRTESASEELAAALRADVKEGLPQWCYERAEPRRPKAADSPSVGIAQQGFAGATLWFGDIPTELADVKALNKVFFTSKPSGVPPPFIKKLVKQGYKAGSIAFRADAEPGQNDELCEKEAKDWAGYAFVEFRDTQEAKDALAHFDGRLVEGWKMRVQWAEDRHQGRTTQFRKLGPDLQPGQDPPLVEQLFPASLPAEDLRQALNRHSAAIASVLAQPEQEPWVIAEIVEALYRKHPRQEIPAAGVPLPPSLLRNLQEELRRTRWPAAPHRAGMQAQHYLVLQRGWINEGYEALMCVIDDVLDWADPAFGCNRVAVTKDFQGSPHIDSSDVTYQYAVSIGDFTSGGELCIEGDRPDRVWVVDTHDRVAKIDGRWVHWVRGHSGGERYSVIFFSTNPACATERSRPVFQDFAPRG